MSKRVLVPTDVLAVLIDAASKWDDELNGYIIPDAEGSCDEDAEAYHAESARIHRAVGLARAADKEN